MSERPRWLTEAARSGSAVDEVPEPRPGAGPGGPGPGRPDGWDGCVGRRPAVRWGRLPGALRTARRLRPPSAQDVVGGRRRPGRPPRRARLAGGVQLGARHPVGDRDRPRRPGGAGGGRGRRGGAHRYPAGTGGHRRCRRPGREDPDRGLGVGEPVVAVDVVVSVQRKVPVLAIKNPQGQLQVVDASGVPFEVVSALPAGVAQVNAASDVPDPEGIRAAISILQLLSPERRAQVSGDHGDQRRPGHAPARPGERGLGRDRRRAQEAGRPRGAPPDKPGGRRRQRAGHAHHPLTC